MRSGTIGVPSDELSRYAAFTVSVAATLADVGTAWTLRLGMGRSIVKNCNHLVRVFEGDMLWFQADDHVWAPDTLRKLEAHELDVVVPLMLMRQRPFPPVIYEGENENGSLRIMREIPTDSLIEVYAAGTGGMLVSREALDAIGPAPFEYQRLPSGELLGEDFGLCRRFREAGIPIHCDTSLAVGHISTIVAWPEHGEDGWAVRLDFNSGAEMA